jgi:hypothetical protein
MEVLGRAYLYFKTKNQTLLITLWRRNVKQKYFCIAFVGSAREPLLAAVAAPPLKLQRQAPYRGPATEAPLPLKHLLNPHPSLMFQLQHLTEPHFLCPLQNVTVTISVLFSLL